MCFLRNCWKPRYKTLTNGIRPRSRDCCTQLPVWAQLLMTSEWNGVRQASLSRLLQSSTTFWNMTTCWERRGISILSPGTWPGSEVAPSYFLLHFYEGAPPSHLSRPLQAAYVSPLLHRGIHIQQWNMRKPLPCSFRSVSTILCHEHVLQRVTTVSSWQWNYPLCAIQRLNFSKKSLLL